MSSRADGIAKSSNVVRQYHLSIVRDFHFKVPGAKGNRKSTLILICGLALHLVCGHSVAEHVQLRGERKIIELCRLFLVAMHVSQIKVLENVVGSLSTADRHNLGTCVLESGPAGV